MGAGTVLQTIGLKYTSSTNSAFVTALYVIIVPLLTLAIERVRPRVSSIIAVIIAVAGLYLITNPSGAARINLGDILTIGAAFAFAIHIVIADIVTPVYDPIALSAWQIITIAILSAVFILPTGDTKFILTSWSVMTILVSGILATALAFSIQLWAQRESSATHVTIIFVLEPVWAAFFARIIQHQFLAPIAMLGGGLIIFAVLVSQIGAHRRE
jgi:drug/metabolite transporter (DMT)-like permease